MVDIFISFVGIISHNRLSKRFLERLRFECLIAFELLTKFFLLLSYVNEDNFLRSSTPDLYLLK